MLQNVDAMLIDVGSVDMVSKNSSVFLRALMIYVACVAFVDCVDICCLSGLVSVLFYVSLFGLV